MTSADLTGVDGPGQTPPIRIRFRLDRGGFVLDLDLALAGRGVTALFGPSGAGKTTCLRAIAGLERVPGGFLEVNREVWQDDSRGIFRPTHRRALGYVFQEASLFPHLSVRKNLEYGRRRRAVAPPVDFDHLIDLVAVGPLLERRPETLSGGERQRVAIARALLAGPRLLLLDEPLASLDRARKDEILPFLERLHRELEIPVVYVSHAVDEVVRLADHLVLLAEGRVAASGPLTETLARLDLPEEFADEAGLVIEGTVGASDPTYGLVRLDFPGGSVQVVHSAEATGRRLRFQVKARDVSVALEKPRDTSILNLVPARVVAVAEAKGGAHVLVRLDAGGTPLVARITRLSRDRLKLAPGSEVWAQIKAVAVLA
jgi:molybdate transport system ATP-binding protein